MIFSIKPARTNQSPGVRTLAQPSRATVDLRTSANVPSMVAAQGPVLLPPGMSNRQGKGSKRRKIFFQRMAFRFRGALRNGTRQQNQPPQLDPSNLWSLFRESHSSSQFRPRKRTLKSSSIGSPAYATMEALLSRGIATAFTAQLQWRNGDPPVRHAVLQADEVLLMVWGYYYESSGRHRHGWRATTSVSANRREHCGQRSSCAAAAGGSAKNTK